MIIVKHIVKAKMDARTQRFEDGYHEPGVPTAHGSVRRLSGEIPCGWLIRSIHRWSADIFMEVVVLRTSRRPS